MTIPNEAVQAADLVRCHCMGHSFFNRSKGRVVLISIEDESIILGHAWRIKPNKHTSYVRRYEKSKDVLLHRVLMSPPPSLFVDHKNGNGLDNRRENLRLATREQNGMNRLRGKRGKSGFIGVYPNCGRWRAMVATETKRINIGQFDTPEEAARARDALAVSVYGEFATLNFPNEVQL